jgi:hypothetical protein
MATEQQDPTAMVDEEAAATSPGEKENTKAQEPTDKTIQVDGDAEAGAGSGDVGASLIKADYNDDDKNGSHQHALLVSSRRDHDDVRTKPFVVTVAIAAALGGLIFGYDIGGAGKENPKDGSVGLIFCLERLPAILTYNASILSPAIQNRQEQRSLWMDSKFTLDGTAPLMTQTVSRQQIARSVRTKG